TEHLWTIVNDTIQIFGGKAYFSDQPYERMMRDARINTIGEGANDVLKAFIAVVGMRGVAESLRGVLDALKHPFRRIGTLFRFGTGQLAARFIAPDVPLQSRSLRGEAHLVARRIKEFGLVIPKLLAHVRKAALKRRTDDRDEELLIAEEFLKSQYLQERVASIACDLYAASCTLSRLDHSLAHGNGTPAQSPDIQAGRYFLRLADRRIHENMAALWSNDDDITTQTADTYLQRPGA